MSTQQDINAIRAQRLANTHDPLALMANTQTPFHPDHSSLITYLQHPQPNNNFVPQPSFNTNYLHYPLQNLEDISNPTTALDMALELMAKAFQLNNTTPTNNNRRSSSNPCYSQIAQSGMNIDQDRQILIVDDNAGNQFRNNAVQNHGNGNVIAARAEGNGNRINGNPIRCYNCQGVDHYASNCTVNSMVRCEETERSNANCTLENNLQQASTSGTQSDKAPVYDSYGSAEIHKIVKDEILPIVNQVDARVQNFEIQFLKEAAKFVRDFKSLAKEADESIAKQKALELEIERLLREVVSQDIMSIVQNPSVVDTSNLQTKLERTKEKFEDCMIKKENEYAKLWNDWYKKCEECKYDKISYDKAYNDMQQKIERLQAQLGDLKGKCKDNLHLYIYPFDPLNLFDSINVTRTQTKSIIDSLQNKLHDTIYENAKLRAQFFDKVSEQKDTNKGMSVSPKVSETTALSKPVTSNSAPSSRKSTAVNNERVIAPGILRINPFKASRVDNFVPNKHVKASIRTKPITVSQPHVITKNDVNSKTNGFSPKDVKSTTRTRRPQPRNNPKTDKVPFKSKSRCLLNKLEKLKENHRTLQSFNYPDHMSSEYNNIKLAIRNEKSEVICATCKQCLITANHDECVLQYVNGMKSTKKNQSANVSNVKNQKKHKPKVKKPKKVRSKERLASPKPSTLRSCLRWSPTGRIFDLNEKIIATSEPVCQSDCSKGDNACTSNPQKPINKRFSSLTFSMTGCQNWLDTLLIPLLFEYKPKDKEHHGDNECDI
ncbi:retrovirus-related pol polyprotein from transposon TNT 1-94 [Tanacetum coccineum]